MSHRRTVSRLALAVNVWALGACVEPPRPSPGPAPTPAELPSPFERPGSFVLPPHPGYTDLRIGGRLSTLARGRLPAPAPETRYVVDALSAAVVDARFDDTLGDRMEAALEAAEDEGRPVAEYGTGALDFYEMLGDDVHEGACEIPRVIAPTEHEGETWEMTLGMPMIETFVGDLSPAIGVLAEDCQQGLLDAAGDIDASGCSTTDEAMFFAEDSECRACLADRVGDYAACVADERCEAEAPVLESRGGDLWTRLEATLLSCAPDYTVPAYVLAKTDVSGEPPDPWSYPDWGYVCAPFWDPYTEEVVTNCSGGYDTMRVGVHGVVEGMRRDGDDTPWYRHRGYYTPRITLESGDELRWAWEAYSSSGILSYPVEPTDDNGDGVVDAGDDYYGYQFGSWGLDPLKTRPDGADPDALDDTFARDWMGAMALKSATTRNGVSILMANHSRCGEWDDLDGDGVFRCTRTEDPVGGWLGDLPHFRWNPDEGYSYPMPVITLGSTGLPDPAIPGGIVAHIAGTPTLGDPDWDNCTWTDTFVPDVAQLPDTPLDYTSAGSVAGDTWRYGAHDLDLRIVIYTNVARDYCPDQVTP